MLEQRPNNRERLEARVYALNRAAQIKYRKTALRLSDASRVTLAIECLDEVRRSSGLTKLSESHNHITYQTADGVIYCDLGVAGIEVSDTQFKGPGFRSTKVRRSDKTC